MRIEWDHDEWGNVIEERAFGRVDLGSGVDAPGDERITTTTGEEREVEADASGITPTPVQATGVGEFIVGCFETHKTVHVRFLRPDLGRYKQQQPPQT